MNKNKVMKVFEQYMKKFNLTKNSTKAKYFHALKVMELSELVATALGIFSEEEITVCGFIGLFHDNIIKIAIYCYNKSTFPEKLDPKIIHFCRVLKDAHTLETFRLVLNYPYVDFHIDSYPTELVYNTFKEFKTIDNKISDNNSDDIIVILSQVFSLSYRYSYQLLKEQDYISKITKSLLIKDKNIARFFKQIEHVLNGYVNRKIGV